MSTTNSTTPEEPSSSPQNDFTSPVTILPLVISVATLLAIAIVGCVLYRKRQQRRSQELERQLRVTERKIDAIGTLKAKKEQELAARKAKYYPPTQAACSSVSSLSTAAFPKNIHKGGLNSGQESSTVVSRQYEEVCVQMNPIVVDETHQQYVEINVQVSPHEKKEDPTYYSSSCKESELGGVVVANDNKGVVNTSMSVECETIPSASSLSTVYSRPEQNYSEYSRHLSMMSRSQSERRSRRSNRSAVRNMRYRRREMVHAGGPSPLSEQSVSHTGTWGSGQSGSQLRQSVHVLQYQSNQFMDQDEPVQGGHGGRPNSPVSSVTVGGTTDTEGGASEKWV